MLLLFLILLLLLILLLRLILMFLLLLLLLLFLILLLLLLFHFKLDGRHTADSCVKPSRIVERFDVIKDHEFCFAPRFQFFFIKSFRF